MKKKLFSEFLVNRKAVAILTAVFFAGIVAVSEAQIRALRPGVFRRPGKPVPVSVRPLPVQSVPVQQSAPVQQSVPAQQSAPVQQSVPAQQSAPVQQSVPAQQSAPVQQSVPAQQSAPVQQSVPAQADPVSQNASASQESAEKDASLEMDSRESTSLLAPVEEPQEKGEKSSVEKNSVGEETDVLSDEKELLDNAVDEVLERSENREELAPVLRKVEANQIQKAVEDAIRETEEDQKNETINGIVEDSLKEVDEDAIEESVNQVMEETVQLNQEADGADSATTGNEEEEDVLPNSVEKVLSEAELRRNSTQETVAEVSESDDELSEGLADEPAEESAEDLTEESAEFAGDVSEPGDELSDGLADEPAEDLAEELTEELTEDSAESDGSLKGEISEEAEKNELVDEAALQPMATDFETVKLADMDQALAIPAEADFDELTDLFLKMDRIRPSDLNTEDAKVAEEQVKEFLLKTFTAKLGVAEKMLAIADLTEEQWETAVSLKVQSLANLFRLEPASVETLRQFVQEIETRASKALLWEVKAVLIQMELCQFQTEPTAEELKRCVVGMLTHLKSGIEQNCLDKDFALSAVQMVILTEDKLPEEEYLEIFKAAIQILNSSEDEGLKETAKLLKNILKQKDLVGQPVELSLTTYDGKTVKTTDYAGKTLLFYYFSFENQNDLRDLSLIYQFFMAYQSRGFEVIGIVSGEKRDEMDQLLKEIPWPMVFEKPDADNSLMDYFAISVLPAKVLVNVEGKIEKANVDATTLMKYLEQTYGPVVPKNEQDVAEADETQNEVADDSVDETEETVDENTELEALEPLDALDDADALDALDDATEEAEEAEEAEPSVDVVKEATEKQEPDEIQKQEFETKRESETKKDPETKEDSELGLDLDLDL